MAKREKNDNKTNAQISHSRFFIIKWWPEGGGSVMRKHWLLLCSVIKWWPNEVRGREMISTGLCAPGQRKCVRCSQQYGYLWPKMLFCRKMADRLPPFPNGTLEALTQKCKKKKGIFTWKTEKKTLRQQYMILNPLNKTINNNIRYIWFNFYSPGSIKAKTLFFWTQLLPCIILNVATD